MKIIISPAKKIKKEAELFFEPRKPVFLDKAKELSSYIKTLSYEELKKLLVCNDDIARLNYDRYQNMDFKNNLHHALLAYDGIQYQYMAPLVFDNDCFEYLSEHLRILSGLYGILHPLDGIQPYRLEMQAKLVSPFCNNIYDFWKKSIYDELVSDEKIIVNLASKEYSKTIEKYLSDDVRFVSCIFGDVQKDTGKVVEKGVYVKMARGEMVRFMAENKISDLNGLTSFTAFDFCYNKELSNKNTFVFSR